MIRKPWEKTKKLGTEGNDADQKSAFFIRQKPNGSQASSVPKYDEEGRDQRDYHPEQEGYIPETIQ